MSSVLQFLDPATVDDYRERTRIYLTETLLPFWIDRSPDLEFGGFLTYFDSLGRKTGETTKTFLMQIRMLYTLSSAHRAGYGDGRCAELARAGARFIHEHYWDQEFGGWIWITDREGRALVRDKVGYGQVFALYAFSEYFLATGDQTGLELSHRTWESIEQKMADPVHGGYFELMDADWTPKPSGASGGDRKSFDVHMHLMEALTTYFEATRETSVRTALLETMALIQKKMIEPETGTGWIQFALDFTPLPAIIFNTQWGRDAAPEDGVARPLDTTSYGHNVEYAWLLLHAYDILGHARLEATPLVEPIFRHCVEYGIDWEVGGVLVEGPMKGRPTDHEKQFWQQAEVLIGMLDAVVLTGDPKYWDAFKSVHDFVFRRFVVEEVGEWYERVDRLGKPIDSALGHAWKISYHTVRSMIQSVRRLRTIEQLRQST